MWHDNRFLNRKNMKPMKLRNLYMKRMKHNYETWRI